MDRAVALVTALDRQGVFVERGYKSVAGALGDLLGWERFEARRRVVAADHVCFRTGLDGTALPARLPATAAESAAGRASLRHVEVVARVLGTAAAGHDRQVEIDQQLVRPKRCVLFDVDGTLIDSLDNQRQVWGVWAARYGLDPDEVYRVALRTRPMETFAIVLQDQNPQECLSVLHELEDEDVRSGEYAAFDGAIELLRTLPLGAWALVTSNYDHRVRGRFARTGLPVPEVIIDATAVDEGKPSPVPYLLAAERLRISPTHCLVIEDTPSGVQAGLSAGMMVWSVNAPDPVDGAHHHYTTLREASNDITAFARCS
jgi:sugar-phosphatase